MSSTNRTATPPAEQSTKSAKHAPVNPSPVLVPRPLAPRRGLFITLCVLFAVWVGFLVMLYFTSVYPQRHPVATQPVAR